MKCLKPVRVKLQLPAFGATYRFVRCGSCISCRVLRRSQITGRMIMESKLHKSCTFITLTYAEEPKGGVLIKKDLTDFLKRLRYRSPQKLRYFATGEYGKQSNRPHYHLILFGHSLHQDQLVHEAWNKPKEKGFVHVAEAKPDAMHYVAKYCLKDDRDDFPIDPDTGQEVEEFHTWSRKPGIGFRFIKNKLGPQIRASGLTSKDIQGIVRLDGRKYPLDFESWKVLVEALGEEFVPSHHAAYDEYCREFYINYDTMEIIRGEAETKSRQEYRNSEAKETL